MAWYADKTIGAGKDFATISLFEGWYDGSSLAGTDGVRGKCTGDCGGTGNVYWAGWQSGQSESIKVVLEADTGEETDFVVGSGGAEFSNKWSLNQVTDQLFLHIYNCEFSAGKNQIIEQRNYVALTIINSLLYNPGTSWKAFYGTSLVSGSYVRFGGCLFIGEGTGGYAYGVYSNTDLAADCINCTFASWGGAAIRRVGGTVTVKNCAVVNCTSDLVGTISETTNLSENDGDLTDSDADDFTEPSTDDYHVYDTNSALYQAGTSVADSWFTSLCPTDIDGTTWAGTPAVGCFEYAAAGGAVEVNATTDALVITENTVTIAADTTLSVGTDALVITEYSADVDLDVSVSAGVDALLITENTTAIAANTELAAGIDSLIITEYGATVDVGGDIAVSATTDALVITENTATITADTSLAVSTDALVITENTATITADTSLAVSTDALVITENSAGVNLNVLVSAGVQALTITDYGATIKADTDLKAGIDALILSEYAAAVSVGGTTLAPYYYLNLMQ